MTFSRMITDVEQSVDSKYQVEVSYDAAHPDVIDFRVVCRRCHFKWNITAAPRSYLETMKRMHDEQAHPSHSGIKNECEKALSAVKAFDPAEAFLLEDEKKFLEARKKVLEELKEKPDPEVKAEAVLAAVKHSYEMQYNGVPILLSNEVATNQTPLPANIPIPETYWSEWSEFNDDVGDWSEFNDDVAEQKVKLVPPTEEAEEPEEAKISPKVKPVKTDRKRRVLG